MTASPKADGSAPLGVDILGVKVSATRMDETVRIIEDWITNREAQYVCVSGMHGVMECQRDERLRGIHNAAGLVTPDGMSLVWLCKLKGHQQVERVYGPDLMLALCERSPERGYRHFFYGSSPAVLERSGRAAARALAQPSGSRHVRAAVPLTQPPGRCAVGRADHRVTAGRGLGGLGHAETGALDGGARGPARRSGPDRCRSGVRLQRGDEAAGATVDAAERVGMALPTLSEPRRLWRRYLVSIPLFAYYLALDALGLRDRPRPAA